MIPLRSLPIHNFTVIIRCPGREGLGFIGCYRCQILSQGSHTLHLKEAHNVESSGGGIQVWFEFKGQCG